MAGLSVLPILGGAILRLSDDWQAVTVELDTAALEALRDRVADALKPKRLCVTMAELRAQL